MALISYFRREEVECDMMQTIQNRFPEQQVKKLDALVKKGKYPNRSEAVRDAVRRLVDES